MKLEELVPDIELCKLIPQGEFEDTALMWVEDVHPTLTPFVEPRRYVILEDEEIPAPTFEEIMKELGYFIVSCFDSGYSIEITTGWECAYADSAVDGPMKLWLKTKGIEYGN